MTAGAVLFPATLVFMVRAEAIGTANKKNRIENIFLRPIDSHRMRVCSRLKNLKNELI